MGVGSKCKHNDSNNLQSLQILEDFCTFLLKDTQNENKHLRHNVKKTVTMFKTKCVTTLSRLF